MSRPDIAMDKFTNPYHIHKNPLRGVDIDAEYKLIQQKKSKLSAKLRRVIVAKVEARETEEKK